MMGSLSLNPSYITCQNIYKIFIKHKPFSSQVEDKSGFPLKTCRNDKPYISFAGSIVLD